MPSRVPVTRKWRSGASQCVTPASVRHTIGSAWAALATKSARKSAASRANSVPPNSLAIRTRTSQRWPVTARAHASRSSSPSRQSAEKSLHFSLLAGRSAQIAGVARRGLSLHANRLLIAAKRGLGTDTALSRITGKAILPATEAYILRLWLRQEGNWISEDARGKWRPSRQCGSSPQSVPGMPCWRKPNRAAISAGSSARSDSGPALHQAVVAAASPEGRMKPVNPSGQTGGR